MFFDFIFNLIIYNFDIFFICIEDQKDIKNQFNDIGERVDMFLADNPGMYEMVSEEIEKSKYVCFFFHFTAILVGS